MKKYLILILAGLLLISQNAQAQYGYKTRKDFGIKGPVRLYKKRLMKEFSEKQGKFVAGYNHIIDHYIFDEKGSLTADCSAFTYLYYIKNDKIRYEAAMSNDLISYISEYRYPEKNRIKAYSDGVVIKEQKYNENHQLINDDKKLYRTKYEYNEKGQLLSKTSYKHDKLQSKHIKKYNDTGKLTEEIKYDSNGEITYHHKIEYSKYGQLIKHTALKPNGSLAWRNEYKYLLKDSLYYESDYFNSEGKLMYQSEFIYDIKNRLERRNILIANGKNTEAYEQRSYKDGQLIKKEVFLQKGKMIDEESYANFTGNIYRLKTIKKFGANGNLKSTEKTEYDDYGNELFYEAYKYFDKNGIEQKTPIEKRETTINYDGDPMVELWEYKVENNRLTVKFFNDFSSEVKVFVYNKTGQLMAKKSTNEYVCEFDLSKYGFKNEVCFFIIESGDEISLYPFKP